MITVFSRGIMSSMEISKASKPIEVLLSSPYLSEISSISSRITRRRRFLSSRIAFNLRIFSINSAYSVSSFSLSRPVSARRRISTIAWACTSVSSKRSISSCLAIWTLLEPRMIRITSSILSRAFRSPSKIWALSCALFRSYWVLLVTTSSWWAR